MRREKSKIKIGKQMNAMRMKKHLTRDELAILLTVATSTVRKWETDKQLPDYENVKAMHQLLEVSIDELLKEC